MLPHIHTALDCRRRAPASGRDHPGAALPRHVPAWVGAVAGELRRGPAVQLADAFGARYDLRIPLTLFVVGGGLVVVLSFLLVVNRPAAPEPVRGEPEAI